MTEQYILKRRRNGRFSKKGYVFNDERWMNRLKRNIISLVKKVSIVSFIIGILVGMFL